jgi:hypothetical protein
METKTRRKASTVPEKSIPKKIICGLSTVDTNLGILMLNVLKPEQVVIENLVNYYSHEPDVPGMIETAKDAVSLFPTSEAEYTTKKYKGVGKALLEFADWVSVKCEKHGRISLSPLDNAVEFYKSQKFKIVGAEGKIMVRTSPAITTPRLELITERMHLVDQDITLEVGPGPIH